jgi:hypothetical protein
MSFVFKLAPDLLSSQMSDSYPPIQRGEQEDVPERAPRRIKLAMFRPSTWAIFKCKLEVQIEIDLEHAKDMFQV